jgi:quercetin dioxygenase-like cupin family protein
VLSGRLRFTFEGHIEELDPGDSVYYDSGRKHGMIANRRRGLQIPGRRHSKSPRKENNSYMRGCI